MVSCVCVWVGRPPTMPGKTSLCWFFQVGFRVILTDIFIISVLDFLYICSLGQFCKLPSWEVVISLKEKHKVLEQQEKHFVSVL